MPNLPPAPEGSPPPLNSGGSGILPLELTAAGSRSHLNYASPLNYAPPARNDLRQIAVRQKAIMYCILGYIVFFVLGFVLPEELRVIAGLGVIAAAITGAVFVFMLAISIYNTAAGILLGLLTMVPLIGMIVLLIVNMKATAILRAHGIRVGLMGADTKQIPQVGIIP